MKEWAPSESDIKNKKEAQAKAKESAIQAEKIMTPEQTENILKRNPWKSLILTSLVKNTMLMHKLSEKCKNLL